MHPHEMSPEEQQMIWGRPIDGPVMTEFLQAMLNDHHDLATFDVLTREGTVLRIGMTQTALRTLYLLGKSMIHGPTRPSAS